MAFMSKPLEKIAAEVLQLAPADREALLGLLIASLPREPGYDEAWNQELDRRLAAIEDGTAELIPGDLVFARLKSDLR